jgi:hypothetical protein
MPTQICLCSPVAANRNVDCRALISPESSARRPASALPCAGRFTNVSAFLCIATLVAATLGCVCRALAVILPQPASPRAKREIWRGAASLSGTCLPLNIVAALAKGEFGAPWAVSYDATRSNGGLRADKQGERMRARSRSHAQVLGRKR